MELFSDKNGPTSEFCQMPDESTLPIDRDAILREFGGNDALLGEAIDYFKKSMSEMLPELHQSEEAKDSERIAGIAHKICGSAANLTIDPISRIARRLEQFVEAERWDQTSESISQLERQFERLQNFLDEASL